MYRQKSKISAITTDEKWYKYIENLDRKSKTVDFFINNEEEKI